MRGVNLGLLAVCHAVLAAVLLVPGWPGCQPPRRFAAGQGLSITNDQLGAGEIATADEFSRWEEALELASQTTGGRSIGGKGGTRTGAIFKTANKMEQLQLSMYYISGSPKVYNSWNTSDTGGVNLVPRARDQGECWTCVAQAVATAMQMAVSSALHGLQVSNTASWVTGRYLPSRCTTAARAGAPARRAGTSNKRSTSL